MNKEIEFAKLMIKNRGLCNRSQINYMYKYTCKECPYFKSKKLKENEDFDCFSKQAYVFFIDFLKQKENGQLEFNFE